MRRFQLSLTTAAIGVLVACSAPGSDAAAEATAQAAQATASRAAIVQTLEQYMVAARAVDAARVSSFYAPNGELFEPGIPPIVGPDSIRVFMASFPGVRVDVATSTPDTIEVFGNTALMWGKYFEKLAFPGQPYSEQHGKFVMEWVLNNDKWLIQRYYRIPLPAPR